MTPVVWDGTLRIARGTEPIQAKLAAAGAHLCFDHPMAPEVLILGPVQEWLL